VVGVGSIGRFPGSGRPESAAIGPPSSRGVAYLLNRARGPILDRGLVIFCKKLRLTHTGHFRFRRPFLNAGDYPYVCVLHGVPGGAYPAAGRGCRPVAARSPEVRGGQS
jgi:hypothetical protein